MRASRSQVSFRESQNVLCWVSPSFCGARTRLEVQTPTTSWREVGGAISVALLAEQGLAEKPSAGSFGRE